MESTSSPFKPDPAADDQVAVPVAAVAEPVPPVTAPRTRRPWRLLVLDDEDTIRFALSDYFEHAGFTVMSAATAAEALARARGESPPTAALVDLRLSPGPDGELAGLAVVAALASCQPPIRVVVLSAYLTPDREQTLTQLGAAAVLAKPQPLPELARILRELIALEDDEGKDLPRRSGVGSGG